MDTSQLKSITVGINLNDRFEADGIGLISVNSKYFTKSGILGNFYDHIASKDRINEDTIWKKNFKFQPFDVNADAVISTPMQKVMDTAVMRSESRGGIVKLPEGDQAKDVTRYTDRIVNHMISPYGEKSQRSTEQICFYYHYRHDRLDSGAALLYQMGGVHPKIAGTGLYLC